MITPQIDADGTTNYTDLCGLMLFVFFSLTSCFLLLSIMSALKNFFKHRINNEDKNGYSP